MSELFNQNDAIVILGKRGSGKTSIVKFLLNILADPQYNFRFTIMDIVGNLQEFEGKSNIQYYLVDPNDKDGIDMVIDMALKEGNQMVCLDEADRYRHYETSKLSELVNVGRNFNCGYITTARRCIPLTEKVYTSKGVIEAKYLNNEDEILGGNIKDTTIFTDEIYELTVMGNKVRTNGEHPFLIRKIGKYPKTQWISAKEIFNHYQQGYKARWYAQEANASLFKMNEVSIGKTMAKLYGYILSDGYISKDHSFKFTNTNRDLIEDVKSLVVLGGYRATESKDKRNRGTNFQSAYNVNISFASSGGRLLQGVITSLRDQTLSLGLFDQGFGKIQQLPIDELKEFISGYFNGDGCLTLSSYPRINFYIGIDEQRAHQMQFMLWRLGIHSTIKFRKGSKSNYKGCWIVSVARLESVKTLVDFLDDRKYPKRFEAVRSFFVSHKLLRNKNTYVDASGSWVPINKVEKAGIEEVKGWETSPTHLILLRNGIVSHNTANLDKDYIVNANWVIIFKHTWPEDIDRITEWLSVDENVIRSLQPFEFLLVHDTEVIGKYKLNLPKDYTIQTVNPSTREPTAGGAGGSVEGEPVEQSQGTEGADIRDKYGTKEQPEQQAQTPEEPKTETQKVRWP